MTTRIESIDQVLGQPKLKRLELSGLDFTGVRKPFAGAGTSLRRCRVTNCDFTGCNLSGLDVMHSRFERVTFERANLTGLSGGGNTYIGCDWSETRLKGANLGAPWPDRFVGCSFRRTRFESTLFADSKFDDCVFDDCIYAGEGQLITEASFERCVFRGKLDDITFGTWEYSREEYPMRLKLLGGLRTNRMLDVDFSEAVLWGVSFIGGVDLSTARLPADGRHRYYRRWPERVQATLSAAAMTDVEIREGVISALLWLKSLGWQGQLQSDRQVEDFDASPEQQQHIVNVDWLQEAAGARAATFILENLGPPDG